MFYRQCSYVRFLLHQTEQMPFTWKSPALQLNRKASVGSPTLQDLFLIPRIHNLLRLITFNDPVMVHNPRFKSDQMHSIKVLGDAELKAVLEYSSAFTAQRLQFPPILAARSEHECSEEYDTILINSDPELQGILPSNNKIVFTDISLGESRRNRLIAIRESDGRLRHAVASERDRINQVYFPLAGRRLRIPMMFEGRYLKDMLDRRQFVYLLDRACAQFEPDDPQFIAVYRAVYDHVGQLAWTPMLTHDQRPADDVAGAELNSGRQGNPLRTLRHTRYYGPMALYLIAQLGQAGALLYEALTCQHYARVGWILLLSSIVKPESPFARALAESPHKLPEAEGMAVGNSSSHDREVNMSAVDVDDVLACLQLFINVEPLSSDQKALLHHHLLECQKCIRLDRSTG